jgi:hypothetical protein
VEAYGDTFDGGDAAKARQLSASAPLALTPTGIGVS